jgi:23S rRNA (adenine2030-N6)-methyltransferase
MNYRHAFHAGNFADVHKHAVLARILVHLRLKPGSFRVIDTHAGAGRYDLLGPEAARSGEWRDGIERVWKARRPGKAYALLAPYLDAVAALNPDGRLQAYPGSPVLAATLLRPQDRLVACELEPGSAASLTSALRADRRAKVLMINGWTVLSAHVPPVERRGVVIVDPPFEEPTDFLRLSSALSAAHRKWASGIYLLWYPIKDRDAPDALARRLRRLALPKMLRCELTLGPARREAGLVGSGLIVVNPPFSLQADLRTLMPVLGNVLSPAARSRTEWLVPEAPAVG